MKSKKKKVQLIQGIMLGDCRVGKTSICKILNNQPMDQSYKTTIGIDLIQKEMELSGKQFKLSIWDASGQQKYKGLIPGYIRKISMAFVVFDITSRKTFKSVGQWVDQVNHHKEDKAIFFLIGNKMDAEAAREVEIDEAEETARLMGAHYVETSAFFEESVFNLFEQIGNMMNTGQFETPVKTGFRIVRKPSGQKKKCCNC